MFVDSFTANILAIIFFATIFRSAFGFGESLIAVPLLALLMPLNVAVPLSVLVSITIAVIVVVQDLNKIHFLSAGGLIGFTLVFGCGLLAGILGGAYGINGPPLVIYGAKRRWSAQHFRATLQGYFLIASIVGIIGY
jgi:uncharacterized membrane protein YfcA